MMRDGTIQTLAIDAQLNKKVFIEDEVDWDRGCQGQIGQFRHCKAHAIVLAG
jgi:hypothetical protein